MPRGAHRAALLRERVMRGLGRAGCVCAGLPGALGGTALRQHALSWQGRTAASIGGSQQRPGTPAALQQMMQQLMAGGLAAENHAA